jgi:hypothetical protein
VQDLGLSDFFRSRSRGGKVGRVLIEVLLGGSAILVTEVCLATDNASAEADRELLTDVAVGQAAASTASGRVRPLRRELRAGRTDTLRGVGALVESPPSLLT